MTQQHSPALNNPETAIAATCTVKGTVDWLMEKGVSPLPVAPAQDPYEYHKVETSKHGGKCCPLKEGKPIPLFTGKNPSYLDPDGKPRLIQHKTYQKRLPTQSEINLWWQNPNNGVGALGNESIAWIDIDAKHFESQQECNRRLEELLDKQPALKPAPLQRTHSGGYRIGVATTSTFTNFSLDANGPHHGELLGDGRFAVLAPTVGPSGNPYQWVNYSLEFPDVEIEQILFPIKSKDSQEQAEKIKNYRPVCSEPIAGSVNLIDCLAPSARAIYDRPFVEGQDNSEQLTTFIKEVFGWANWLQKNSISYHDDPSQLTHIVGGGMGLDGDRIDRIIESCGIDNCFPSAHYRDGDEPCQKRVNKLLGIKQKGGSNGDHQTQQSGKGGDRGKPKDKSLSLITFERLQSMNLRWNELLMQIEYPDGSEVDTDELWHDFRLEGMSTSLQEFAIAAKKAAKANAYHPVRQFLESVDANSPPIDIRNLSRRYFGTFNPIYDEMLYRHLIASVARVFTPGCKKDEVLVLQGKQGILKSTFWETLYGEKFFTDATFTGDRDDLLVQHRYWVRELGELEHITGRKQAGEMKAFLSRSEDTFREPYGRCTKTYKRSSVFVGSVNPKTFLFDDTGNRRFWVIPVEVEVIDIDTLAKERDAIWAAAVQAYRAGEKTYLSREHNQIINEINQNFRQEDSWMGAIRAYIEDRTEITISDILLNCLKFDLNKITKRDEMRCSTLMAELGWERGGRKSRDGKSVRLWIKNEQTSTNQPLEVGQEVGQSETLTYQGLNQPNQPNQPISETLKGKDNQQSQEMGACQNAGNITPSTNFGKKVGQVGSSANPKVETFTPTAFRHRPTPDQPSTNPRPTSPEPPSAEPLWTKQNLDPYEVLRVGDRVKARFLCDYMQAEIVYISSTDGAIKLESCETDGSFKWTLEHSEVRRKILPPAGGAA